MMVVPPTGPRGELIRFYATLTDGRAAGKRPATLCPRTPEMPCFLTVLPLASISSAIGAGLAVRANCYGAKRL
jgi:hypothetical protein